MEVATLKHTAKLVCVGTLLDRRLSDSDDSSGSEYITALLETGCFTAVSHKLLQWMTEYVPHKLTNGLLQALIPPHAREISVPDCLNVRLLGLVDVLKKCRHVQMLNLRGCSQLMSADIFTYCSLLQLPLTSVSVEGISTVTDEIVQTILRQLPHLTALNVSACRGITDDAFLIDGDIQMQRAVNWQAWTGNLAKFQHGLKSVDLSGCAGITSVAVRRLTSLCGPHLQHVNVAWTRVDCSVLFHLAGFSFPTFINFVLDYADVLRTEKQMRQYLEELMEIADVYGMTNKLTSQRMANSRDISGREGKLTEDRRPAEVHNSNSLACEDITMNVDENQAQSSIVMGVAGSIHSIQSESGLHSAGTSNGQSHDGLHSAVTSIEQSHGELHCSSQSSDVLHYADAAADQSGGVLPIQINPLSVQSSIVCDKTGANNSNDSHFLESAMSVTDTKTGLQENTCKDLKCVCVQQHSLLGNQTGLQENTCKDLKCVCVQQHSLLGNQTGLQENTSKDVKCVCVQQHSLLGYQTGSTCTCLHSQPQYDTQSDLNSNSGKASCKACDKNRTLTNEKHIDKTVLRNSPSFDCRLNSASCDSKNTSNYDLTAHNDNMCKPASQVCISFSDSDIAVHAEINCENNNDSTVEQSDLQNVIEQTNVQIIIDKTGVHKDNELTTFERLLAERKLQSSVKQEASNVSDSCEEGVVQLYTPSLTSLNITEIKFPSKKFGQLCLSKFFDVVKSLQRFELSWKGLTEEVIQELVPSLSQIQELYVEECTRLGSAGVAAIGRSCTQLKKINLRGVVFFKDMSMAPFFSLQSLTSISLAESEITDTTLMRLANRCGEKLQELDLSYCEEITEAGLNAICKKCINLRVLKLQKCPVSDVTLHVLANNCRRITELNIEYVEGVAATAFTERGVLSLAETLGNLTVLNISWNLCITNTSVKAILTNCPRLKTVNLNGLKLITCEPFLPIVSDWSQWTRCKQVLLDRRKQRDNVDTSDNEATINDEVLKLQKCPVSDVTLHVLANNCRRITELNIEYVEGVAATAFTERGVLSLAETLGNLTVLNISWNLCITNTSVKAMLTNCPRLKTVNLNGLKLITCEPFLPIVSDWSQWTRCKQVLLDRRKQRDNVDTSDNEATINDEELCVPHRSTSYAANLKSLHLEYSDLVEDALLTDVVWVCRGSLTVHNYYGEELQATSESWDKYPDLADS